MDILTYFSKFVEAFKQQSDLTYFKNISLNDILVPIETTIHQAIEVESNHKLLIEVYGGKDIYSVPYPWGSPIRPDLYESDIDIISQSMIVEWRDAVNSRIYPLIHNAISKNRLDKLDSDDDIGIIIHSLDGELEVFHYSDVDEIRCAILPEWMPTVFKQYLHEELNPSDMAELITTQNAYRLAYDCIKTGYPVDSNYTLLTPFAITFDQCCGWSTYINTMIKLKSKIIYLI